MEYGLVALWWLVFLALGLLGAPLAARLLPGAPDRGAGLALPLGLLLVLLPTYWVGQFAFGVAAAAVGVVVLVAASALAGRDVEVPRREYLETAVVFTLAFAFLLAVRAVEPSAHPGGGEKFLDFGLLQSLLRAPHLPPEDMWFAGKHVVYYYGGHLYAATLALLTGTPGRYAYNLALAGAYATEVTAAFGLARDVAADRDYPARTAGAIAAVLFGLASNLDTPVRLLAGALPKAWVAPLASALGVPYAKATVTPATFSFWPASRAMHDGSRIYITEFPFFSYLNGDLHAHMLVVTFSFLLVGICYAYWRTPERDARRRRLLLLACAPVLGYVLLTNVWSVPTLAGVVVLTVALAPADPRTLLPRRVTARFDESAAGPLGTEVSRVAVGLLAAAVVGVVAFAVVAPYVDQILLAGVGGRVPALLPQRSPLGGFLLVQGAFLLVLGSYLVGKFDPTPRRVLGVAVVAAVLAAAGSVLNLVGLALAGPLVAAGWWLLRARRERDGDSPNVGFETLLLVAGAGLLVVVEFLYLKDDAAPGRLNTVFKAYFSVWALWSVAGGVALGGWLARARARTWLPVSPDRRRVVGAVCVALLLVALVGPYAGLSLDRRFANDHADTLDAMAFTHTAHPNEAAAIEWLNDRPGRPHIVARPGTTPYQWRNPASSLTGVPTVAGWVHEAIYRGSAAYHRRVVDVGLIFTTNETETRHVLLRKYDVRYVWDGPLERAKYGNVTRRLDADPALSVAYRAGGVTVYGVHANATAATANASG